MSDNVTSEEFKEFKERSNDKFGKLSDDLETYKDHLRTLDTNIQNHVVGCGLDAYKAEMRERCERLNDRIKDNKTEIAEHKHDNEMQFKEVKEDVTAKNTSQRGLSNKIISTAILFGIALIGIFGGINVNKVSQTEFRQHIEVAAANQEKQVQMLDKFIESYTSDRIRREEKLDIMFSKQLEFNQGIMKNTSLLQAQLEVLKTKVEDEGRKGK